MINFKNSTVYNKQQKHNKKCQQCLVRALYYEIKEKKKHIYNSNKQRKVKIKLKNIKSNTDTMSE